MNEEIVIYATRVRNELFLDEFDVSDLSEARVDKSYESRNRRF